MAELGIVDYGADNLIVATKKLITEDKLLLESGENVVRSEVLARGTTGLVALAAITDIPYCVALQDIDATSGAKKITYTKDGGVLATALTFAVGGIDDFRDGFATSTNLFVEEK